MSSHGQTPNPQGKGLLPVLDALYTVTRALNVPAKPLNRIADELFTSLFVLSCAIKFKPVLGRCYWLYRKPDGYRLSLIAPEQWSETQSGLYVGQCELQNDLTWSLELSERCLGNSVLMVEIARQREDFDRQLQAYDCIEQALPTYSGALPFYARVLASGLACSLGQSMYKSGINGLSYSHVERREIADL